MNHGYAFGMFGIANNHQNRKENTMAQVILNLEIDEILRAFTTGAKNEGFRLLLQKGLNAMLERESSEQLGAKRYERTGTHGQP